MKKDTLISCIVPQFGHIEGDIEGPLRVSQSLLLHSCLKDEAVPILLVLQRLRESNIPHHSAIKVRSRRLLYHVDLKKAHVIISGPKFWHKQ